jgi:ketosteroid isomerase-like protein
MPPKGLPLEKTTMNHAQIVQAFFDAYTAHDVQAMLALCSPTATFRYVPFGERGIGSVYETAARLWQLYMDVFLDFSTKVMSMMEGKDGTIVCETLNSGTQARDVGNIKNKGRKMSAPHLYLFTFESKDSIEKITAFWDNDSIYAQLGHTETQT